MGGEDCPCGTNRSERVEGQTSEGEGEGREKVESSQDNMIFIM